MRNLKRPAGVSWPLFDLCFDVVIEIRRLEQSEEASRYEAYAPHLRGLMCAVGYLIGMPGRSRYLRGRKRSKEALRKRRALPALLVKDVRRLQRLAHRAKVSVARAESGFSDTRYWLLEIGFASRSLLDADPTSRWRE
jgi:hypothetical protein